MLKVVLKFSVEDKFLISTSLKEYATPSFYKIGYIVDTEFQEDVWNQLTSDPTIRFKYDIDNPTILLVYTEKVEGKEVSLDLMMKYDSVNCEFLTF